MVPPPAPVIQHKRMAGSIATEPGQRWVIARITTTSVDRDGDVVLPGGGDLSDFVKNPVVLFGHDASQISVGQATEIRQNDDDIIAKIVFNKRPDSLPDTVEWKPDTVHDLFKQGALRAFSIGFTVPPGGARSAETADVRKFGPDVRRVIQRWKLVEFSVVPVPANQDALAVAVSKGMSVDKVLEMIGDGQGRILDIGCDDSEGAILTI